MEALRDHWTDDRMDDLAGRMDDGFNRIHTDLRDLRQEVREQGREIAAQGKELRGEMAAQGSELRAEIADLGKGLRAEMNTRFIAMDDRLAAMHRMMFGFCSAMLAALIGLAGVLVTQI
jgi:mono/diheme cytochrome c family protein